MSVMCCKKFDAAYYTYPSQYSLVPKADLASSSVDEMACNFKRSALMDDDDDDENNGN